MRSIIIIFSCLLILLCGCKEKKKKKENFKYFRNYSSTFNDMNSRHLKAAKSIGIIPVVSEEEIKKNKQLKKISSCSAFEIDPLTHSYPYLVTPAYNLLNDICEAYKDSLEHAGLPPYNLVVTSTLRTNESVKHLKKKNTNASSNSAHIYGTTFDIAYARFKKLSGKETEQEKLKSVLADVLHNFQKAKRCYVRYEYKQGCFHITARN